MMQSAGSACPDVVLVDYKTGEEKSLAEIVGNGKPTVVDFCAELSLPPCLACAHGSHVGADSNRVHICTAVPCCALADTSW
jgi:hypothetical protein|eukprot:COSAG02_NODE_7640_length_2920_cov_5.152074_4_plen_81_part_00